MHEVKMESGRAEGPVPNWESRAHRDYALFFHCHPEEAQAFAKRRPANEGAALLPEGTGPHDATGEEGAVEIESRWTARRREQLGAYPVVRRRDVS
jgi:hypothetical protein